MRKEGPLHTRIGNAAGVKSRPPTRIHEAFPRLSCSNRRWSGEGLSLRPSYVALQDSRLHRRLLLTVFIRYLEEADLRRLLWPTGPERLYPSALTICHGGL